MNNLVLHPQGTDSPQPDPQGGEGDPRAPARRGILSLRPKRVVDAGLPLGVPSLEVSLTRIQAVVFYAMEADPRLALTTDRERLRAIVGAWDRTYTPRRVGDAWSALRDLHAAAALNVRGFARDRSKPLPEPPSKAACERAFANIVAVLGWQGKDPKTLAHRWQQFHAALIEPSGDRPSLRRQASKG